MKRLYPLFLLLTAASCYHSSNQEPLSLIQIEDRNGLTETITNPERLPTYEKLDFLSAQPYKKVMRVYKKAEGKKRSILTTYHPNGMLGQYLEAEEMRAHGAYREWFPSGQIKLEAKVIAGTADLSLGAQEDWVFDSVSQVWDEQGNLIACIPYDKGMIHGKSIYYYPSGQVERELCFVKNKLDGESLEYWPDGKLKARSTYKKGVQEGPSLGFFNDGQTAWKEDYLDGRLRTAVYYTPQQEIAAEIEKGAGFKALFDEKGDLTLFEYRVGLPDGLVQNFNPFGHIKRSYFLKAGKKQGEEIEYYLPSELEGNFEKPMPKMSIQWVENQIHGCVKTWYNQGQLQSQREYARNKKTGPSLGWYRDGSLMLYEEYEEDLLLTGQYYKVQKKEPISSVIKGNGLVTLFDENGLFLRKISYLKGKPVDPED